MNVSRIDKFVRERTGAASLDEARSIRERDVEFLVGARAGFTLVRSAVALALRCFSGTVHLCTTQGGPASIIDQAVAEAGAYGTPDRLALSPSSDSRVVRIGLGCVTEGAPFADAAGWVAAVNELLSSDEPATAPSAAFAVACAFGKVFAGLLGAPADVVEEHWAFSLLSLSSTRESRTTGNSLSVGTLTLIGAGAIGSAFSFILRMSGWRGHLRIVDPQRFDEPNHETTLLISMNDALMRKPKAQTLALLAARDGLTTEGVAARVDRGHEILTSRCDVLVCGVDNPETRCVLDDANCDLLLNAGVGGSHLDAGLVVWSRHGEGDRTLASLYASALSQAPPPKPLPPPTEVGGDQCSRVAYEGVALAAPFMALASAALLAAGIAQHTIAGPSRKNYLQLDLLELQHKFSERHAA